MSKRSRTFQPSDPHAPRPTPDDQAVADGASEAPAPASAAASAPPPASKPSSEGTSRADARRRDPVAKAGPQQSFFGRYRVLILGGAGVAIVLVALLILFRPATKAYDCLTFLTPPPTGAPAAGPASSPVAAPGSPSPSAEATPLVGFQTSDLGREHVVQGTTVKFAYCPPTSGGHYNLGGGQAPLPRRFFGPTDSVIPPQWIHNLEHGYVMLLYRDDPGTAVLDELRSVMDEANISTWSLEHCGPVNKVIVARFDDMDPSVHFAAVAWDRVLLLGEFDREQLLTFANQWQDGPQTPERVCG